MFHPELGPLARFIVALAVFAPSGAAAYGVWAGLAMVGAPDPVAAFPAAFVAIVGIITITYGIETLLVRRTKPSTTT